MSNVSVFTELEKVIFPDLKSGRLNWDLPHTKAVVHWTKELLAETKLDQKVLITAAYAHDWGYINLFPQGVDYAQIQKMKPKHMEVGAGKIKKLLESKLKDSYSQAEINRVVHLVRVHDKLTELKDEDELLLMEADTLGALDTDWIKRTFSEADNQKYIQEVIKKRRPLFIHKKAADAFEKLLVKREKFYLT